MECMIKQSNTELLRVWNEGNAIYNRDGSFCRRYLLIYFARPCGLVIVCTSVYYPIMIIRDCPFCHTNRHQCLKMSIKAWLIELRQKHTGKDKS